MAVPQGNHIQILSVIYIHMYIYRYIYISVVCNILGFRINVVTVIIFVHNSHDERYGEAEIPLPFKLWLPVYMLSYFNAKWNHRGFMS